MCSKDKLIEMIVLLSVLTSVQPKSNTSLTCGEDMFQDSQEKNMCKPCADICVHKPYKALSEHSSCSANNICIKWLDGICEHLKKRSYCLQNPRACKENALSNTKAKNRIRTICILRNHAGDRHGEDTTQKTSAETLDKHIIGSSLVPIVCAVVLPIAITIIVAMLIYKHTCGCRPRCNDLRYINTRKLKSINDIYEYVTFNGDGTNGANIQPSSEGEDTVDGIDMLKDNKDNVYISDIYPRSSSSEIQLEGSSTEMVHSRYVAPSSYPIKHKDSVIEVEVTNKPQLQPVEQTCSSEYLSYRYCSLSDSYEDMNRRYKYLGGSDSEDSTEDYSRLPAYDRTNGASKVDRDYINERKGNGEGTRSVAYSNRLDSYEHTSLNESYTDGSAEYLNEDTILKRHIQPTAVVTDNCGDFVNSPVCSLTLSDTQQANDRLDQEPLSEEIQFNSLSGPQAIPYITHNKSVSDDYNIKSWCDYNGIVSGHDNEIVRADTHGPSMLPIIGSENTIKTNGMLDCQSAFKQDRSCFLSKGNTFPMLDNKSEKSSEFEHANSGYSKRGTQVKSAPLESNDNTHSNSNSDQQGSDASSDYDFRETHERTLSGRVRHIDSGAFASSSMASGVNLKGSNS